MQSLLLTAQYMARVSPEVSTYMYCESTTVYFIVLCKAKSKI